VDLRTGVQGSEWDELMDAILPELPHVDRVRFLVPELTGTQERLLEALAHVITGKGVDVERRLVT
jgi:hypothetical protein